MSLAQGNNTPTRPRIEPGSPDQESHALTTRPVRSPLAFLIPHMIHLLDRNQIISNSVFKSKIHNALSRIAKFISLSIVFYKVLLIDL